MTNDTQTTTPAPASNTQESNTPAAPAPTSTLTAAPTATTTSKPKTKSRQRRNRTRRRAAASDQESGDEAAGGGGRGDRSDSSLSSRSEAAHSESDDGPEERSAPTATGPKSKGKGSKSKPVFADVSSITPAGWSGNEKKANGEGATPISFEDFNAGKEPSTTPSRGTGISIRGRGKGKVEPPTKREYTPEETAKYELLKAKRREKVKAKKAALKEEKQKGAVGTNADVNAPETARRECGITLLFCPADSAS